MSRGDPLGTGRSHSPVDAVKGEVKWKFLTSHKVTQTPVVVDGVVYIGANDSTFYALNAKTGKRIWASQKRGDDEAYSYSSPVVVDDCVITATQQGTITSFRRADGTIAWQQKMPNSVFSCLRVFDGKLLFGSSDKFIYALNVKDGSTVWRYETGDEVGATAAVTRSGRVYFPSLDKNLYCLNAKDGTLIKKFDIGYRSIGQPAIDKGCIYFCMTGRKFACIDLADGTVRWTQDAVQENQQGIGVNETDVFVHISRYLFCYDGASGAQRWRKELEGGGAVSPCIGPKYVYIADQKGFCYALDQKSGDTKWKVVMNPNGWCSPVLVDGMVYIGDASGWVYGIE